MFDSMLTVSEDSKIMCNLEYRFFNIIGKT